MNRKFELTDSPGNQETLSEPEMTNTLQMLDGGFADHKDGRVLPIGEAIQEIADSLGLDLR